MNLILLAWVFVMGTSFVSCSKEKKVSDVVSEDAPLIQAPLGDIPDVDGAKGLLRPALIQGRNRSLDEVKLPLVLPKRGPNGVVIEWSSNNEALANPNTGEITRPALGSEDTKVRLTAQLTKGKTRDSRSFSISIKAYRLEELSFESVYHGSDQNTEFPSSGGLAAAASASQIVVGTAAGLARSNDGGNTWGLSTVKDNLLSNVVDVVATGGNTVIAGQIFAGVSVSFDGGLTFKRILSSVFSSQIVAAFVDGSTLYLLNYFGLFKSTNEALSWTEVSTTGVTGSGFVSLYASGSTLMIGHGTGLSVSTNGGSSWTNLGSAEGIGGNSASRVLGIVNSGAKFYLATAGGLAVSTNSGSTWATRTTASGLTSNSLSSLCVNSNGVYVSYNGSNGVSWSTNDGTSWTTRNTGEAATAFYGMACTNSIVYATSSYKIVSASVSNHTFGAVSPTSRFTGGTSVALNSTHVIAATSQKTYVASQESNAFAATTLAGGAYWVGANDASLYIGANNGGLWSSSDLGATVAQVSGSFPGGAVISGKVTDQLVLAGTGAAGLGASTSSGSTFSTLSTSQGIASNTVYGVEAANGSWYLATSLGLSQSSNNGTTWQTRNMSQGLADNQLYCVAVLGNTIFAGSFTGLSFSTNSGASFENFGKERGLGSVYVRACGVSENALYVGTADGFSISVDGGKRFKNFADRDGLPGKDIYAFAVRGGRIYVMTSEGLAISKWKEGN